MNNLRFLLIPFSILYGLATRVRNILYDKNIFSTIQFDLPIINVGNLSTGGSGKTPMVEFLIEKLYHSFEIATMSRGYRRTSKGFVLANSDTDAYKIGDEPYQYFLKYPKVNVSVCEDRVIGVPELLQLRPETDVIILDDAYQHRGIKPGLNILLTEYDKPYYDDFLLPVGNLREAPNGKQRADIIIVSKSPASLTKIESQEIVKKIGPEAHQKVYFSSIRYGDLYLLNDPTKTLKDLSPYNILAVSGLAKPEYFIEYLRSKSAFVHPLTYKDHYKFRMDNIEEMVSAYNNLNKPRIMVITEKDASKLIEFKSEFENAGIEVWVQPIKTEILFNEEPELMSQVTNYITKNLTNGQENESA